MSQFRTPTGQTGTDAYIYEAAQIRNCLRELNARAAHLAAVMADEMPDDTVLRWPIPSERFPDATTPVDAESLRGILAMSGIAADAELLGSIARSLACPSLPVVHSLRS